MIDISDPYELNKYGCWPNKPATKFFGHVDSRPKPDSGFPNGEEARGIILYNHPEALERDTSKGVRKILHMWRYGIRPSNFTLTEYRTLTNYELELFEVCRQVTAREKYRRKQE